MPPTGRVPIRRFSGPSIMNTRAFRALPVDRLALHRAVCIRIRHWTENTGVNNVPSETGTHLSPCRKGSVSMDQSDLNRRDFHRLTMAAFGGALAGSMAGCSSNAPPAGPVPASKTGTAAAATTGADSAAAADESGSAAALENSIAAVGVEKHLCRGLNACKGQGNEGENACAGQGS